MSRVGAVTTGRLDASRSGRPPRETTAPMSRPYLAADHRAAADPRAGPEIANGEPSHIRLFMEPPGDFQQPFAKKCDVEHVGSFDLLLRREQVEEERRQSSLIEDSGDEPIPRAVST